MIVWGGSDNNGVICRERPASQKISVLVSYMGRVALEGAVYADEPMGVLVLYPDLDKLVLWPISGLEMLESDGTEAI